MPCAYHLRWCLGLDRAPAAPHHQDAAVFFEAHVVITVEAGAVAVETTAGSAVCDYFKDVRATIHQNYGLLIASRRSIDEAAYWFITFEWCCQQQLLIEASGITPN